jgi:pimeloyl-ACP methyl ester carboxylesterase
METFTADDGEQLHLRVSGNGSPILFLHGWTSSHTVWRPLLEALSPQSSDFSTRCAWPWRPSAERHANAGCRAAGA